MMRALIVIVAWLMLVYGPTNVVWFAFVLIATMTLMIKAKKRGL